MVRWLVEQHGVGAHEEDTSQRYAHLPAARQGADVAVHHLLAEGETGEHLAGAAFESIPAELLKAALHLAVALDDRVHFVRPGGIGHGSLEFSQLGRDGAHRTGAVHHLGHGASARHLTHVLAEVADGDTAIGGDLALVGLVPADDHAEERRLAGAVRTDEADFLPPVKGCRGFDEEDLVAVLLADIVETDHMRAFVWR